jgi:thioredoxin reductase/bacterioferritin-associated ferredoxin
VTEKELVIIGAGPAGLTAAVEAADAGAEVLLVDENERLGGQFHRQSPFRLIAHDALSTHAAEARELFETVESHRNISVLTGTTVWGVFDERILAVSDESGSNELAAKTLIIAAGSRDRAVPFPGWTLPGVFPAGGASTLLKRDGILPGRRVLLAGTGPLQLSLADDLVRAEATVVALLEATPARAWLRQVPKLMGERQLLREGIESVARLLKSRVRILTAHTLVRVEGEEQVARAVVNAIDAQWQPIPGKETSFDIDAVITGFGFVPSIELTRLAGCRHRYDHNLGGWIPSHSEEMQTTIAGVFVAGETAGVAGAQVAKEQGKIAGITAAKYLGYLGDGEAEKRSEPVRRRLRKLYKFRAGLDALRPPREGLLQLMTPDTVVCRCEEIRAKEVYEAIEDGATTLRGVKVRTRAGMGHCQGRMCATTIAEMVAHRQNVSIEEVGAPSIRPPARPLPLAQLIQQKAPV